MPRIKIEVANIQCLNTEDFFGSDEIYLLHNLRVSDSPVPGPDPEEPIPQAALGKITESTKINDGDVKRLPVDSFRDYNILFDGKVEGEQVVTGSVYLIDKDFGELNQKTEQSSSILSFIGFLIALPLLLLSGLYFLLAQVYSLAFLSGTLGLPAPIAIPVSFILIPIAFIFLLIIYPAAIKIASRLDKDDYLGGFTITESAVGPDVDILTFVLTGSNGIDIAGGERFSGTAGKVFYRVNVSIIRFD